MNKNSGALTRATEASDPFAGLTCTGNGKMACAMPVSFVCASCQQPYCEEHRARFHDFGAVFHRYWD